MFETIEQILEKDKRYKLQAYSFVLEALDFGRVLANKPKHITGKELLEGLKNLAIKEFGVMALNVLESWGIKTTDDVGEIVFNLIDAKLLSKIDEDKKEDFHNVFNFYQVFVKEYPFTPENRLEENNGQQNN